MTLYAVKQTFLGGGSLGCLVIDTDEQSARRTAAPLLARRFKKSMYGSGSWKCDPQFLTVKAICANTNTAWAGEYWEDMGPC